MSEWHLSLKRHPEESPAEPSFELTVRGDELGELVGKALRDTIQDADDDSPSPVYILTQIVSELLNNAISYQDGALGVLQQALLWHENDEGIASLPCGREAMQAALRRALGLKD